MRPLETAVAVRQQPLTATESPTLVPAAVSAASISSSSPPPSGADRATRPRSRTIPVNTRRRLAAERERLERLARDHLDVGARAAALELADELLDRIRLLGRELIR